MLPLGGDGQLTYGLLIMSEIDTAQEWLRHVRLPVDRRRHRN